MPPKAKARSRAKARALVRGEPVVRQVLAAALVELARAGYHGMKIDDVAARAGVNKTTVYRRWPTKQELVRDGLLSITTDTFSAPDTGSLRTDMLALARRNAALAARSEHQGLFRIFAAGDADGELAAIVRSLREAFASVPREVLAAAEARGEIAPGIDPTLLFDVFGSALNWWLFFERTAPDDAKLERLVDLLLHGALAPRALTPPREGG